MLIMQEKISFNSNLAKYGIGLFETIKVINGQAVFLEEHLKRLYNSIQVLEIDFDLNQKILKEKIEDFAADLDEKALRVTVCDQGYNFSTRDISYQREDYKQGYDLTISNIKRSNNPLHKHKTTNYFTNLYVRKEAQADGYDEALFLNSNNYVLESTMANLFFIKDQKIYTPSSDLELLPGIIRNKVIMIANELGLDIKEVIIEKPELTCFDFAFVTNSLLGVMKVNKIAGIEYQSENNIFTLLSDELKQREMRR